MNHSQKGFELEEFQKNPDKWFRKINQNGDIKIESINKIEIKNKENSTDLSLLNKNHSNNIDMEFEEKNINETFAIKFKKNRKKISDLSKGEEDDSYFLFKNSNHLSL